MRKNKANGGFSLVELIIVIAIMAILVGVMAPQLIKYIEKTNVSADTQLCDTVKLQSKWQSTIRRLLRMPTVTEFVMILPNRMRISVWTVTAIRLRKAYSVSP